MISAIGVAEIGARWRGTELGTLRAVVPLPADSDTSLAEAELDDFAQTDGSWQQDFDELVGIVLQPVVDAGAVEVVAPRRGTEASWERLKRLFTVAREERSLVNPDGLRPDEALCVAARRGSRLAFASVRGRQASVETSDGRPILWIWSALESATWSEVARRIAQRWTTRALTVDVSSLAPPGQYAAGRVRVHAAGQVVYWTDGVGVLALTAELLLPLPGNVGSEDPRRVFVPSEHEWRDLAPSWARGLYRQVVSDLEAAELRVVLRDGAEIRAVHDGRAR